MPASRPYITVLVSNDLEHDQRVAKVCTTLTAMGYDLALCGRTRAGSKPFNRPYRVIRFHLWFSSGVLFYAHLNIRLFFFLLFAKTDSILANDLDTLLPAFLVSKLRGKKLYYDSHEYFTEAEGLTDRPFQKWVWSRIEGWIFPKLKKVYTVNQTIADIYQSHYHVPVQVVRNVPAYDPGFVGASRSALDLPDDRFVVILQGAYIDPDRGGIEAVEAMNYVENTLLLVIGSGRAVGAMTERVHQLGIETRVRFMDRMPYAQLKKYTACSDLGLSLDRPVHLNYTYSLPNKLFDYIHAGIPVLMTELPELLKVMNQFEVGIVVRSLDPKELGRMITEALESPRRELWKRNTQLARDHFNWQNEEKVLQTIFAF